eukprot:5448286-Pyramimonas_sp.AAC.1
MAKRVKAMLRHVSQYLLKENPPSWFSSLNLNIEDDDDDEDWGDTADGGEEDGEEEDKEVDEEVDEDEGPDDSKTVSKKPARKAEPPAGKKPSPSSGEVEYDYAYDSSAKMAYRTVKGKRKDHPEYAVRMKEPKQARATDSMIAVFKDESGVVNEVAIGNVTVSRYRAATLGGQHTTGGGGGGGKKVRDAANQGFLGENAEGIKVEAYLRNNNVKDKPPQKLTCIKVGHDQLLQVDVKHFEKSVVEGKTMDQTALDWASALAEKVAQGT